MGDEDSEAQEREPLSKVTADKPPHLGETWDFPGPGAGLRYRPAGQGLRVVDCVFPQVLKLKIIIKLE